MENIVAEVRNLFYRLAKLEFELAIWENITTVLLER